MSNNDEAAIQEVLRLRQELKDAEARLSRETLLLKQYRNITPLKLVFVECLQQQGQLCWHNPCLRARKGMVVEFLPDELIAGWIIEPKLLTRSLYAQRIKEETP